MTKVAIYARYSSDLQSDNSIEDQFRMCRARVTQEGWSVYREYSDRAISGATMARPGLQAMLTDAAAGKFDILITEALDRVGRDLEAVAGIHKRLKYKRISWITLNTGEVNDLTLALLGAMASMFLSDLAHKTRRGLEGVARAGRCAGGKSYGYDNVQSAGSDGKTVRGVRVVNDAEAAIVSRIFTDYLSGKSPRSIAVALNKEGVPGPTGGPWADTTINGNRKRGTGILNNELYIGVQVWNRQTFGKNPDTARREARLNDPEAWVRTDVPELRIISQETWDGVKAYQDRLNRKTAFNAKVRPPKLLSYLLKCGCCGGGYSMISANHYGCSTKRNKGTCDNALTIRQDEIERRVLTALSDRLMDDKLCGEFAKEYTAHLNRIRMDHNAKLEGFRVELAKAEKRIAQIVKSIGDGIDVSLIRDEANSLGRRRDELKEIIANSPEAPPLVHPAMAEHYRTQVQNLIGTLNHPEHATQSAEIVRKLIDRIVLTPNEDASALVVDMYGDLAGILQIAERRRVGVYQPNLGELTELQRIETEQAKLVAGGDTQRIVRSEMEVQDQMVAGAGSQLHLHPPSGLQDLLVAGTGFEPVTFRL